MNSTILSDITVYAKYAKFIHALGRRETWNEVVDRNRLMHIKNFPQLAPEIEKVYNKHIYTKKVLPSMRSLQFAGVPIERNPSRIYNCAYLPIEDTDAFAEIMFLLLGGTGVGYSVQDRHVSKLPVVRGPKSKSRRYVIGDSIEGWADAVKVLVEAYFYGKTGVEFDYGDIREKGTELVTSGGKAPGPAPLKECLIQINTILSGAVGRKLLPIEAHDIACHIADAVLAGGIRRAAMISLFSKEDDKMINSKQSKLPMELLKVGNLAKDESTYDITIRTDYGVVETKASKWEVDNYDGTFGWWVGYPQRGRANNSVVLLRGAVSEEEFFNLWERIEASGAGEPGVYWTSNLDWGTNPCCRGFCNLVG